jgi:hypothetical protein
MLFLKKYYNIKANSILESVIALTIISICLCFAVMIFATVFSPKTSIKFYNTQNKVNELFFLAQLKNDSLNYENKDENLFIEEEGVNDNLKLIKIKYNDSLKFKFDKTFYVLTDE